MACEIKRSNNGEVMEYDTPLFNNAVTKSSFITSEDALNFSLQVEELDFKVKDNVYYEIDDGVYTQDYTKVLGKGVIRTGVLVKDAVIENVNGIEKTDSINFHSIVEQDTSFGTKTASQVINESIHTGHLNAKRAKTQKGWALRAVDEISSVSVKERMRAMGVTFREIGRYFIQLTGEDRHTLKIGKDRVSINSLQSNFQQYKGEPEFPAILNILENYLGNNFLVNVTQEQAKQQIKEVLIELGFDITSVENYENKHGVRTSGNITAEALIDLTNKVVAISEGQETVENLAEELAHLLIEAYENQNEIDAALQGIENTPEYAQYSETYRELYKDYENTENAVRREILGKILAKQMTRNVTENTLWNRIKNWVRNLFRGKDLQVYKDKIADLKKELSSPRFKDIGSVNPRVFYAAGMNAQMNTYDVFIEKIRKQLTELLSKGSNATTSKLGDLLQKYSDTLATKGLLQVIQELSYQSAYIKQQISSQDFFKSTANVALLNYVENQLPSIITELRILISTGKVQNISKGDKKKYEQYLNTIEANIGIIRNQKARNLHAQSEQIIADIQESFGIDTADAENMARLREHESKELSFFAGLFRTITTVPNHLANLMGAMVQRMSKNTMSNTKDYLNSIDFYKKFDKWSKEGFGKLVFKDSEGRQSSYARSPTRRQDFQNELERFLKEQTLNLAEKNPAHNLTREQLEEKYKTNISTFRMGYLTSDDIAELNNIMSEWVLDNQEQRYTRQYYENEKTIVQRLNLSGETMEQLRSLRRAYSKLLQTTDEITDDLRANMEILRLQRNRLKSLYEEDGSPKSNEELKIAEEILKYDSVNKLAQMVFEIKQAQGTSATPQSVNQVLLTQLNTPENTELKSVYLELQNDIDLIYDKTRESSTQAFENAVANKSNKDAYHFVRNNSNLIFKGSNRRPTVIQETLQKLNTSTASIQEKLQLETALTNLQRKQDKLQEVLRNLRVSFGGEINAAYLTIATKEAIEMMENDIRIARSEVTKTTLGELYTEVIKERKESGEPDDSIGVPTESYYLELEGSGLSELDFIERITDSRRKLMYQTIRRKLEEDIARKPLDADRLTKAAIAEMKAKVLPVYYTVRRSKTVQIALDNFRKGKINYNQFKSIMEANDMAIAPSSQYVEYSNPKHLLNPNFDENNGGRQPNLVKWRDNEYYNMFGIDSNGNPTKNLNEWEKLQAMRSISDKIFENYNLKEDNYLLPQVSKSLMEYWKPISKGKVKTVVNELFREFTRDVVDEKLRGEELNGVVIDAIPKYFISPLENRDNLSTDFANTYLKSVMESFRYVERKNNLLNAQVTLATLRDRMTYKDGDSNIEKMAEEYFNSQFYGRRFSQKIIKTIPWFDGKSYEVDLALMATKAQRFIKGQNLKINPFIPITSSTTGIATLLQEATSGRYLNLKDLLTGFSETGKMMGTYVSEVGKIDRKNFLYKLEERFGVVDMDNRVSSSNFNKLFRIFDNAGMEFHTIANKPVTTVLLVALLHNHRIFTINGQKQMLNFRDYKKQNQGKSLATLKLEFNKGRKIIEYFDNEANFVIPPNESAEWSNSTLTPSKVIEQIYIRNRHLASEVDANLTLEEKSMASRHYLLNFLTPHRDWMVKFYDRKFAEHNWNVGRQQWEKGIYRSTYHIAKSIIFGKEKLLDSFAKLREGDATFLAENGLDATDIENAKLTFIDVASWAFLVVLGLLVRRLSDDPENEDNFPIQFGSYIYYRTVNEVGSVTPWGAISASKDLLDNPTVLLQTSENILKVMTPGNWFGEDSEVKSGKYAGISKGAKALNNMFATRQLWTLGAHDGFTGEYIKDASDFYRSKNGMGLSVLSDRLKAEDF